MKQTKILLLFLFMINVSTTFGASETHTIDGIQYLIGAYGYEGAIVCGFGNGTAEDKEGCSGEYTIPSSVTINGKKYTVVAVGNMSGYKNITKVTIPKTVESVGSFSGCSSLQDINIPEGVKTIFDFGGCISLKKLPLPNSVTEIGKSAFANSGLTEIDIPEKVTSLQDDTFNGCKDLSSVKFLGKITTIEERVFAGCERLTSITIPSSVIRIGRNGWGAFPPNLREVRISDLEAWCKIEFNESFYTAWHLYLNGQEIRDLRIPSSITDFGQAFKYCVSFNSVKIPSSVETIDNEAFYGCENLTSVEIGSGVKSIGKSAFEGCSKLPTIDIPNNVITIGEEVFYGCTSLASAVIGDGVKLIPYRAFDGCQSLSSVKIGKGVTKIANAFYNRGESLKKIIISDLAAWCRIDFGDNNPLHRARHLFLNEEEIRDLRIPFGVTDFGTAFQNCISFTSLTIPNSVESIAESAFAGCDNLVTADLGGGVKSIGKMAFYRLGSLTSVSMGNSVRTIEEEAFYKCDKLETLVLSTNLENIGKSAFAHCTSLPSLTIPGSVTKIAESAFRGCDGLKSLVLLPSDAEIDNEAFYSCNNIEEITFHNRSIGKWILYNYVFANLKRIILENGVESIEEGVFRHYSKLEEVVFVNSSLKNIGNYAFCDCRSLKYVYDASIISNPIEGQLLLPNPLESIGYEAFRYCEKMKLISLPSSLSSIGMNAFNSTILEDVYAYMPEPFEIEKSVFHNKTYNDAVLYVNDVADKYREVYAWSLFFHIINIGDTSGKEDGGKDSGNYRKPGGGGGSTITTQTYYYDITAQGNGEVSVNEQDDVVDFGTGSTMTQHFKAVTVRNEQVVVEIPHYPGSGVPFNIIPDKGNKVKQVLYTPGTDEQEEDVTAKLEINNEVAGYTYRTTDKGSHPKLVVIFEEESSTTPDPQPTVPIAGDRFVDDSIEYEVTGNGTVTIVWGKNVSGSYTIPEMVTYNGVDYKVTAIGDGAFSSSGLTSVIIPNSITVIGEAAFMDCDNLESVSFGEGLTNIGKSAFCSCNSLKSVDIPNGVTSIGNSAFVTCQSLTTVSIPGSVKTIDEDAFFDCENLASLTMGDGVNTIGKSAFGQCFSLSSITIPGSVTAIGNQAFWKCELTSVISEIDNPFEFGVVFSYTVFDDAVLTVPAGKVDAYKNTEGWNMFKTIKDVNGNTDEPQPVQPDEPQPVQPDEPQLTVLNDGDTFEATEEGTTFKVKVISAADKTCQIGADGRGDGLVSRGEDWDGLIPSKVTGSDNMEYTVIGIGNRAFCEYGSVVNLILPETLQYLSEGAFMRCENLMYVTIPAGLKTVGDIVFNGQEVLTEVVSLIEDPQTVNGTFDFGGQYGNNATLIVPAGKVSVYKSLPGWDSFKIIKDVNGNTDEPQPEQPDEPQPEQPDEPQPTGLNIGDAFVVYLGEVLNTYVLTSTNTVNLNKWGTKGSSKAEIPSKVTYEDVEYTVTGILGTATENADQPNMSVFGSNVTEVVIPNTVTSIGACAFWYCENLASVTIPSSVTAIGDNAFLGSALTSVTIPASVTTIGEYAFTSCYNLTKVVAESEIPVNISGAPRFGDDILQTAVLYVPNGTAAAYQNAGWGFTNIEDGSGTAIEPQPEPGKDFTDNGATYTIGDDNTVTIDIVDNISGSYEVPEKVVHNGVEYQLTGIAKGAFENQTGLTEITLPGSIVSIGENAFAGCVNLKAIYIYATDPVVLEKSGTATRAEDTSSVFEGVDKESCILYVPKGCVEKYRVAEGWGEFVHILEIDDGTSINGLKADGIAGDIYDLRGRKVDTNTLRKGIYIRNGKKIVIK